MMATRKLLWLAALAALLLTTTAPGANAVSLLGCEIGTNGLISCPW